MNVLLLIDGREAIPVRAIPFLTNWEVLSPDVIAEALAGDSEFFDSFNGLIAYRVENGAAKPIRPSFWENFVVRDIEALSDRINDRQVTQADGHSQWQQESIAVLPAGSFVWRDEFVPRFRTTFSPDDGSVVRVGSDDEFEQVARNEDIEIDFDPFISTDSIARIVMEGFMPPPRVTDAPLTGRTTGPHISSVLSDEAESQAARRARRYQLCLDAGMDMPDNDYATLPRGIGRLAEREGVSRQTFTADVKAHIRWLLNQKKQRLLSIGR